MEKEIFLEAEKRSKMTRGEMKKLRFQEGKVPAVLYGSGLGSTALLVNGNEFKKIMHTELGENVIINLKLKDKEDSTHPVIVKEWQIDPVKRTLLHIDFYRISLKKEIVINVPIEIKGEAPGVKEKGGVLEHILRELEVKCLPAQIPHSIVVDTSNLQIGESITVKDIVVPGEIGILNNPEQIVVNIVAPTILEEKPEAAIAPEVEEPEVITKGKKEEEEEKEEQVGKKNKE